MEKYVIQLTEAQPSSLGRARRYRKVISVHVSNLRNRPLSDEDREAIVDCIPELYHRIDQVSGLSSLRVVEEQLLRPPTDFTVVPPLQVYPEILKHPNWHAPLPQPPAVKPPAVLSTIDSVLHQVFRGSLVTPRHPDTLTPLAPFRRNSSNQYDLVQLNGQWLPRVISHVGTTSGRVLRHKWRVTFYRTDGQMMLSVFCRFPGEKVRRRLTLDFDEKRKPKRKTAADGKIGSISRSLSRRLQSQRLQTRLRL